MTQVRLPNRRTITMYGTHLEVSGTEEIRGKQVQEILKIVKLFNNNNVMIAADFNTVRENSPIKILQKAGFKDCFTYLGWQHPTYTSWTGKEIDFIFLSPKWNLPLAGCYVYYDAASDHLPIIMDIKLEPSYGQILKKASNGILSQKEAIRKESLELFRMLFSKKIGFKKAKEVVKKGLQNSNDEIKFSVHQLDALIKKYEGQAAAL